MRFKGNKSYIEILLMQHIIVKDMIKENVKERVTAAACRIVVSLQGHELFEHWIENVQKRKDKLPYSIMRPFHEAAKLKSN